MEHNPYNIVILNCFKTLEDAEKHRLRLKDAEKFAVISMMGELYAPVPIKVAKILMGEEE